MCVIDYHYKNNSEERMLKIIELNPQKDKVYFQMLHDSTLLQMEQRASLLLNANWIETRFFGSCCGGYEFDVRCAISILWQPEVSTIPIYEFNLVAQGQVRNNCFFCSLQIKCQGINE